MWSVQAKVPLERLGHGGGLPGAAEQQRWLVYHQGVQAVVRHREGGHLAQGGDEAMQHVDAVRCLREHHHRSLGRQLQAG